MTKKLTLLTTTLLLLFFVACSKKEDDKTSQNALLLYLVDQASGNCAVISKNSAGTIYTATGYAVPKGGCNASTLDSALYTTSASEAKTAIDTYFDGLKAVYDAQTTCSTLSAGTASQKSGVTEALITASQNTLTSGANGCAAGYYRIVSGKRSTVYICKDAASVTAFKALTSYHPTTSITTDMKTNLDNNKTYQTATKSVTKFSDTAISAMRPATTTELGNLPKTKVIAAGGAFLQAVSASASSPSTAAVLVSCAKDILASDSEAKSLWSSLYGATLSIVADSDATAVSAVLTPSGSLTCGYGSGFTETSNTASSVGIGKCPSSYPTF